MKSILSIKFVVILLFSVVFCSAQESQINKNSASLLTTYPEKLYVATDRDIYTPGDTVWISAWLVSAGDFTLEKLEKILYVDLIDSHGNLIAKSMFEIDQGRSKGQMVLSTFLEDGYYQMVAYTNFMKNQGNDFLFKKPLLLKPYIIEPTFKGVLPDSSENMITYYSAFEKDTSQHKEAESDINLSFLPEGGNWVEGIPCQMAFIGTTQEGFCPQFSGTIYNDDNKFVTFFTSEFNGKGAFQIVPKVNTRYRAEIVDSKGGEAMFYLPDPDNIGHTISIQNKNDSSEIRVLINSSKDRVDSVKLILAITQHQKIIEEYEFVPVNQAMVLSIPKDKLKTGITQVTLFDEDHNALSERLIFIKNNDYLTFNLESSITENDSALFELYVSDKNNNPVEGSFAFSLTKPFNGADTSFQTPNIVQYLYLNSDLPGLEANCEYFFLNDRKSKRQTELTLLTNGWRRFSWKEVLVDSIPKPEYPLEQNFYISGTIKNEKTGEPKPNVEVTFLGMGRGLMADNTITNSSGQFVFPVDYYTGKYDMTIQTKNAKERKKDFEIELETNLLRNIHYNKTKSRLNVAPLVEPSKPIIDKKEEAFELDELNVVETEVIAFESDSLLNNLSQVNLKQVDVNADRIRTSGEKMHSRFGPASLSVSEEQIAAVDKNVEWNYGLISVLDELIPGFEVGHKTHEAKHLFDDLLAAGIPLCSCESLQDYEYRTYDELFEFTYNGTSQFRLLFYVDGWLCGFTNHAAQMDWAKTDLLTMNLDDIQSIGFIQYPKNTAIADLTGVAKSYDELFCDTSTAKHIYNNCSLGFDPAPEHIISITTKSGLGLRSTKKFKGIAKTKLIGYTLSRDFYIPEGENARKSFNNVCPTVYWNPDLKTDENGKATAGLQKWLLPKAFNIAVNGMSGNAIPGAYFYKNYNNVQAKKADKKTVASNIKPDSLIELMLITENGVPCKFAEVRVANRFVASQTAIDGILTIKKEDFYQCDSLIISVPAYGNKVVAITDVPKNNSITVLSQVVVDDTVSDINKFIKILLRNNYKNREFEAYDISGVFRQLIYQEKYLFKLTDFGFIHRKTAANNTNRTHLNLIEQVHQYRIQNYDYKVLFDLMNQQTDFMPNLDPLDLDLSFLKNDFYDKYVFTCNGSQVFNGRPSFIISFMPKDGEPMAVFSGVLLIDKLTNAIVHMQWEVADNRKQLLSVGNFIAPQQRMYPFKLISDKHGATYNIDNEKWKLKSASQQLSFLYNKIQYKVINEAIATNFAEKRTKQLKHTNPKNMKVNTVLKEHVSYNPGQWRNDHILLPSELLMKRISGLYEQTVYRLPE